MAGHVVGNVQRVSVADCRDIRQDVQRRSKASNLFPDVASPPAADLEKGPQAASIEQGGDRKRYLGRIPQLLVLFLTAGRVLEAKGDRELLESDRAAFALRLALLAKYICTQIGIVLAAFLFATFGPLGQRLPEQILTLVHFFLVVLFSCGVHIANRFRWLEQRAVVGAFTGFLIAAAFVTPVLSQIFISQRGAHWSGQAGMIFISGSPAGAVLVTDRPGQLGFVLIAAMAAAMAALMIAFAQIQPPMSTDMTFIDSAIGILLSYALMPIAAALIFRYECRQHRARLRAQVDQHNELSAIRVTMQWLIFSIVPPKKVRELPGLAPQLWFSAPPDHYPECSILQMDVSGFTALSSHVSSAEVLELIQSLFVSIDYAAECVQCVWKVELIGDCYKAIVGGPYPCADHARRAVALAYAIVAICRAVATRLNVRLSVRVGVHTGRVTAGVVGVRMPRYLLFGRDAQILNLLESSARPDSVLVSASTAAALRGEWPYLEESEVTLGDASCVKVYHAIPEGQFWRPEEVPVLRRHFESLLAFLADLADEEPAPAPLSTAPASRAESPEGERGEGSGAEEEDAALAFREALRSGIQTFSASTLSLRFRGPTCIDVAQLRRSMAHGAVPLPPSSDSSSSIPLPPDPSENPDAASAVPVTTDAGRRRSSVGVVLKKAALAMRHWTSQHSFRGLSPAPQRSFRSQPTPSRSFRTHHPVALTSTPDTSPPDTSTVRLLVSRPAPSALAPPFSTASRRRSLAEAEPARRRSNEADPAAFQSWNPPGVVGGESRRASHASLESSQRASEGGSMGGQQAMLSGGGGVAARSWRSQRSQLALPAPDPSFRSLRALPPRILAPSEPDPDPHSTAALPTPLPAPHAPLELIPASLASSTAAPNHHRSLDMPSPSHRASFAGSELLPAQHLSWNPPGMAGSGTASRRVSRASVSSEASEGPFVFRVHAMRSGALGMPRVLRRSRSESESEASTVRQPRSPSDLLASAQPFELGGDGGDFEGRRAAALDIVLHEHGGAATSPGFQKTIAKVYVGAAVGTAALHVGLLAGVSLSGHDAALPWHPAPAQNIIFLPALLLAAGLLLLLGICRPGWDFSSGRPQLGATAVLMLTSVALEGLAGRSYHMRWPALYWAFLGVLVQCASTPLSSRAWLLSLAAYIALVLALILLVDSETEALEAARSVEWWREVLMGWSFIANSALVILPMAWSAMAVRQLERRGRGLLASSQKHVEAEDELLAALAPPALTSRFLAGDRLIMHGLQEGTAMFAYVVGYDDLVLAHGANACMEWINAVYQRLDACLDDTSGANKVETFNNFVLVFSTEAGLHVERCLALALRMLDALEGVLRPDGRQTLLKVGVSAGPFASGIIGLQSPRYSIFGDTVNTASRMASTSVQCSAHDPFVHISPSAHALLGQGESDCGAWLGRELAVAARLEPVEVKGKGAMGTFCLTRRGGEGRTASAGWVAGAEPPEEARGLEDGEEAMQLRDAQHRP